MVPITLKSEFGSVAKLRIYEILPNLELELDEDEAFAISSDANLLLALLQA